MRFRNDSQPEFMKKAIILLVVLAVMVTAFTLFYRGDSDSARMVEGLPWQIEILPGGESRVFGIRLGHSTLADAAEVLGEGEVAIIVGNAQDYGLEMFFSRYTAGVFSGKLVLAADLSAEDLQQLVQRAERRTFLESGGRKFTPASADLPAVMNTTITSITFLPKVNLDQETAMQRFGAPAKTVISSEQQVHLLYPDKGLDIIINDNGGEVLQYVAPKSFTVLQAPLNRKPE